MERKNIIKDESSTVGNLLVMFWLSLTCHLSVLPVSLLFEVTLPFGTPFWTCQNNFCTSQNNFPTCQNNFPTCLNNFHTCLLNFSTYKWIQKKMCRNNFSTCQNDCCTSQYNFLTFLNNFCTSQINFPTYKNNFPIYKWIQKKKNLNKRVTFLDRTIKKYEKNKEWNLNI